MSDFFSRFGDSFEHIRNREAQEYQNQLNNNNAPNFAAERDQQLKDSMADIRQRNERAQKLREKYGYDYTVDQYAALANAIDSEIINEDQGYDILTAQTISDNLKRQGVDIDPVEIYNNLPAYSKWVLDRPEVQSARTPKTNLAAIHGAFVTAGAGARKNILGIQLASARSNGNKELERIIKERLGQEDQVLEEYGDYQKRNFFVEAGKFAAQSSVYTLFVTAGGMLGGAPGAFAAGWAGATGQSYLGLDAAGVKHEIAYPFAIAMGAVNSLIESQLGNAAGLVGRVTGAETLQSALAKRAANYISDKLHLSGAALRMATGPLANYIFEIIGETNEEVFQEISDIVFTELAAFIQKEGVTLDRDYIRQIAEAAKGGFMASLIMGVPGLAIDSVHSVGDYALLRNEADSIPNEKIFKERNKDSPLRGDMTDEEWDKELSKIHEGRRNIREQEEARIAAEIEKTSGLGTGYEEAKTNPDTGETIPLGETYRTKKGLLYTELDEKRGLFKIGDPRIDGSKNLYSHIEYTQDEDGTVRIKEFRVRNDLDTAEFRHEAYDRFAESFAGVKNIVWESTTEHELTDREVEIRKELIERNPFDKENGLNYYPEKINIADEVVDTAAKGDTAEAARAKLRFGEQMARHLPGSTEASRSGAVRLIDRIGRAYGLTFDKFIEKLNLDPNDIFTHKAGKAVEAENKAAAQFAKEGENAGRVKGALQPWRRLDSDMKSVEYSIVYLDPAAADFSTVIHELKHAVDNFLEKTDPELFKRMMDAAGEYDPKSGMDENTWRKERSAYAFENYLATGEAPTSELRNLFRQMKEWLAEIINYLNGMRRLTPEQKKVFDELLSKADKVAAEYDAAQAKRTQTEAAGLDNVGQQREAAKERYEANKKFNDERPLLDKNNGKKDPKPRQTGVTNAQELRDKAAKHIEELRSWVNDISKKYDVRIIERPTNKDNPLPLKTVEGIQRKLNDGDTIEAILDVMSMTIVAKDLQTLVKITEELRSRDDVVRIKDRYKVVDYFGYRDVLANVRLSDEMIAEVQINIEQMLAAKSEFGGHKYYEIARILEKEVKAGTLTIEQANIDKEILAKMSSAIYEKAYQATLSESQFNAASLESLWHSDIALLMENRDGESVLSSFTLNKLKDLGLSANNSLEYTSPSMSKNLSSGSSNDGTSTAGTEDVSTLSGEAVEADKTESSNISVPSTNSIEHKTNSVNSNFEKNKEKNSVDDSGLSAIRERYEAAEKVYGDTDTINVNGEEIEGRWVVTEAQTPTASHDETTFNETEGFLKIDGKTINDRDYKRDRAAQEAVLAMANNYDSRALEGVVVSSDGIVISGNNRTMSGKLAAKNGTDGKYLSSLQQKAKRYGFTEEQVRRFTNPRLLFEVEVNGRYDTALFAQFNRSTKKAIDPVETAVKMAKLVKPETVKAIAAAIKEHESVEELYKDKKALQEIFNTLKTKNFIGEYEMPQYYTEQGGITGAGEDLLENVLLGATLKEDNIRVLSESKNLRRKLAWALPYLIENGAMGGYSVIPEVNEAVRIAADVEKNSKTFKNVEEWAEQKGFDFMEQKNQIAVELAKQLEGKNQSGFADMMGGLNAVLSDAAEGQADLLASGIESKENIVRRFLGIKAEIESIRSANNKIIENEKAPMVERAAAAMDNAGLAKIEADGPTMFQMAYHGSPFKFDRFDSSHMGKGEGAQAYGWGHYFAGKKEIAEWYREKLSFEKSDYSDFERVIIDGRSITYEEINDFDVWYAIGEFISQYDLSAAKSMLRDLSSTETANVTKEEALTYKKVYDLIEDSDKVTLDIGQLYEVDLPGDEEMLDWDKKLKDMPERIRKLIIDNAQQIFKFDMGTTYAVLPFKTGEQIYQELTQKKKGDRAASLYLNSLGVKGIRYLDGDSRLLGEGTHNYVIFDDNDINITQTFFQLDDELVEDAAGYDSWEEFRDGVQTTEASEADNAWYKSLWEDAKKIYEPQTLFQDEEETSRARELDDRFYNTADKKYLTAVLKELYRIHDDQTLKPTKEEDSAAKEEFKRVKRLQRRIGTELPNAGSVIGIAAQVRSGRQLSSTQYDRLKTFMRKNKRDFRSVFADIMGQEEYLEDLADMKEGEPAGRLANPRPEKRDTKARLKEIASIIKETDPALARGIEDGTIAYDDPRIRAFEKGVETEYEEAKAAVEALEKETAEDYARLANDAQKRIVNAHEKMMKAKEQMEITDRWALRRMDKEEEIAKPYLNRQRLEEANYFQALKAYNDLVNLYGLSEEVNRIIDRQKVIANERGRQRDVMLRQRAAKALGETKKKLVKRVTRKISFDNVAHDQAELAITIQRIFFNISGGINKWIGPEDRRVLREVWSQWSTDEEFREKLLETVKKSRTQKSFERADKIERVLNKKWEDINVNEKRTLHKILPKTNVVQELGLGKLAKENWESAQIDIDEHVVDGEAFLILGEDLKRRVIEVTGEELYNRLQNKPLSEWSLSEAEELGRVIDKLVVEGKRKESARKEAKRILDERYRSEVLDALEKIEFKPNATPEEKEKEKEKILKNFAKGKKNNLWNNFIDANLRRFTTAMDGGRKGVFTSLLYWGENDAYNTEQRQIAARRLLIDTVMKENNIALDELYREVEIPGLVNALGGDNDIDLFRVSDGKVTVDDLLYIMRGYNNEETRNAIMYGNLSNARERNRSIINIDAQEEFANIARGRMAAVMNYARRFFAEEENKKFLKLYEAIGTDYDNNGERLNRACIDMFNKPMWRVENYVPMNRREQTGTENENRVIEDLLGMTGAGNKWVNRGFTVKRKNIKPAGQRPIELGLYKTWAKSVTATEHLLAYGPLVQRLNAVFKGYHAGEVRQALHDRWGEAAVKRVDNTIAKFANPNAARETANRQDLNKLVRTLRGKTATAYLAWKTSGVLKQLATSPFPYLQEIPPAQYLAACIEVAGGAGKINDFIREKSIYMKNRDFDPMVKLIREARENNDNAVLSKIDKFNAVGMKGLEWIDWVCVAPGWLAKYRSELVNVAKEQEAKYQELLQKYQGNEYSDVLPTNESKVNRALSEVMGDEQQDAEAVARADDAVRRMQPSSRSTDIAPLYEGQNEVTNILLQFQTALNVIWQNLRYDLPLAIKEKQTGTVVGMVTGYVLAGICLGLLTDFDFDDDDDEKKKARKILFYSFTQFTDAVPVIGDGVTQLAERFLTGKRAYTGQSGVLPVIERGLGGLGNVAGAFWEDDPEKRRKRYVKAVTDMAEAAGLYFGGPVSGAKELGRAVGIGDGDGEFNLYLQALTGRKNKQ